MIVIVACLIVLYRRQKRKIRKFNDDLQRKDEEIRQFRENTYILRVYMEKDAGPHIERAQAMAGAETPEHLACDALDFYVNMIEKMSQGYKFFISKPPHRKMFPVSFESLPKVAKRVQS